MSTWRQRYDNDELSGDDPRSDLEREEMEDLAYEADRDEAESGGGEAPSRWRGVQLSIPTPPKGE